MFSPKEEGANLDGGEEGGGSLGVARGDASPSLEVEEGVLHEAAPPVGLLVVVALHLAALHGRDDHLHARRQRRLDDGVRVVALVAEQLLGGGTLYEGESL